MNFRRRLMMAQLNEGFELVYDAASGRVPSSIEWLKYYAPFGSGYYKQQVVDNTLELTNFHMYEKNGFYPIEHEYANRCSMSVEFKGVPGTGISIHLTDGTYSALGVIKNDSVFYVETNDRGHKRKISKSVKLNDINTLTVIKNTNFAEYYLNDELLYTQTDLFLTSIVGIGNKGGAAADSNNNGFITQRRNSAGTAYGGTSSGSTTYITKIIYKEW